MGLRDRGIEIKTPAQVEVMRRAGLIVGETLQLLGRSVAAGITTLELDTLAEEYIRDHGAVPNFKGYHGFPGTICTSVNDEVVHGIPGGRRLEDGDIISIDCGCIVDGWHGDAAVTVAIGEASPRVRDLIAVCEESMWRGIAAAALGGRVTDIGHAIETDIRDEAAARGATLGIVEDYVGHGIGSAMHQPPNVPNYGRPDRLGRRPMWWGSLIGLFVMVIPMFMLMATNLVSAIIGFAVLGLLYVPQLATISATFPAMFPTHVRFAGFVISYNVATSLFGGTAPAVNDGLANITENALTPAYYMMASLFIGALAMIFVVETRGCSLRGTEIPGTEESEAELAKMD